MANFRVELPKNNPLNGWEETFGRAMTSLIMRSPIELNAQYVSR